ncbi:lantibiotic dehydratase [Streptomyces sp. BI20]|uniref:lantibiotic dehydratase n=1 Tax=Streptomyces sp. BI20 TaxID=3403460 RepID=UPI003C72DED8
MNAVLVRAAVHTETELPDLPAVDTSTAVGAASVRTWLGQVWAVPSFAEAVTVASPVLATQVSQALEGRHSGRRLRKIAGSVGKYVLRGTGRATPFGQFAGVAAVSVGESTAFRWGSDHHVVVGPDGEWVARAVAVLTADPMVLDRMVVVANPLCRDRGERLVLPPAAQSAGEPAEVLVRSTPAVLAALAGAHAPIAFGDLVEKLAVDHPAVPDERIRAAVTDLVNRRFLLSALEPPMSATDPLGHLAGVLGRAGLTDHAARVRAAGATLARAGTPAARGRAVKVLERLGQPGETPALVVNLALDADLTLPVGVLEEAERAASAMTRLSPAPHGFPAWAEYHGAFLDRYGPGALVPVLDLTDPVRGLGLPARYRGSTRPTGPTVFTRRDADLIALAQRAALEGRTEIHLTPSDIDRLAGVDVPVQPYPHAELRFHLQAPTRDDVDAGDFRLVVVGASRAASTTMGRFLPLLDPVDQDRMRKVYEGLPTMTPGARAVQVSAPPSYRRTANVARAPRLAPVLSVGEYPANGPALSVTDLAVGADSRHLYLVHLPTGDVVEPFAANAVSFRDHVPGLVRFLCELPRARATAFMQFYWGAASSLPFLPRIRVGRTVLAQARWNLPSSDLPAPGDVAAWDRALALWRATHFVPAVVSVGESDTRLRLNLDVASHRSVLRDELAKNSSVSLVEAPTAKDWGWAGGRAHEVTVPLSTTVASPWTPPAVQRQALHEGRVHPPGAGFWLSARIGVRQADEQAVLDRLPLLIRALGTQAPVWWLLPYADPAPHLLLRLRITNGSWGTAADALNAWANTLMAGGLVSDLSLVTYRPETARYGSGPVMDAVEEVFAADTSAALIERTRPSRVAVGAASLLDLAASFLGGFEIAAPWLAARVPYGDGHQLDREALQGALRITERVGADPAIAEAWAHRQHAVRGYREHLRTTGGPDPDAVLSSLLHLHCVRLFGVAPDVETQAHRVARAVSIACLKRRNVQ